MKKKYFFVIFFLVLAIFFIINTPSVNAKMYKILDSEGNIIRLTNNPVLLIKEKEAGYTISPPPEEQEIKKEVLSKGEEYDFIITNWGMRKEEVKIIEKAEFIEENRGEDDLQYKGKVDGLDCYISYFFEEGKLMSAGCHIIQTSSNKDDYIKDYKKLKEYLIKKYGKPFQDYLYGSKWDTSTTEIHLFLSEVNNVFDLLIFFKSEFETKFDTEEFQIIPETENISESNIISLNQVDLVDFYTSFTPKGDSVNIQGTLKNYGKEIINNAEINVKCKNEEGKIMLIKTTSCQPLSIAPGSEAYFNLKLDNNERISSFRIFLFDKYLITKYLEILKAKANVVNWSSNLSKAGDYIYLEDRGNILIEKAGEYVFINGTIENIGNGFMSKTRIDVRGVDSLGRLVSTNSCVLNPQEIGQKQTSFFKCVLSNGTLIDRFIIDINWINPQGNRPDYNEIELKK